MYYYNKLSSNLTCPTDSCAFDCIRIFLHQELQSGLRSSPVEDEIHYVTQLKMHHCRTSIHSFIHAKLITNLLFLSPAVVQFRGQR
jgi:hypothetical protein